MLEEGDDDEDDDEVLGGSGLMGEPRGKEVMAPTPRTGRVAGEGRCNIDDLCSRSRFSTKKEVDDGGKVWCTGWG